MLRHQTSERILTWALERLARWFEAGAKKYGDRNWEKGQTQSRLMDSALRHLCKHMRGQRDEDHLAAAAWNVMCALDQETRMSLGLLRADLNDLPEALPKDVVTDGNIANLEQVSDGVKRAWKRLATRNRNVALALPAAMVITKKIIVPSGQKEEDLEFTVEAEANQ